MQKCNTTNLSFDSAISFSRILGTFFILSCHFFTEFSPYSTILAVAVPLFLFISGYLYGKREIEPISFLKKRYKSITMPVLVFVTIMALYYGVFENQWKEFIYIPQYVLNLQGLSKIIEWFPSYAVGRGTSHLWYLTAAMICYVLTIPVQMGFKKYPLSKRTCILLLIISIIVAFVGGLFPYKIRLNLFQIYFVGYFYSKYFDNISHKKFWVTTFTMFVFGLIMIFVIFNYGDTDFYVGLGYIFRNFLAYWIFLFFKYLCKYFENLTSRIIKWKFVRHMDTLSFYIYIVHYIFTDGPFCIKELPFPMIVQFVLFLVASVVLSEVLFLLCKTIFNKKQIAVKYKISC